MKRTIAIIAAMLMLTGTLAACGKDKNATPDSAEKATVAATSAETVKPTQKSTEGNTVETDSEGNTIEKDKDGTIVSVKDKNGGVIEITEYTTTHHITVTDDGDDSDDAPSAEGKGSDGKGSSSKAEPKEEEKPASSAEEKDEEPTSAAPIIPDGQDEYELPII